MSGSDGAAKLVRTDGSVEPLLTPCAPVNDTMGDSSPLVRLTVLTSAFFRCPSPDDATVMTIVFPSSSSSSTRARFVRAKPGPAGGGDFRTDMAAAAERGMGYKGLGRVLQETGGRREVGWDCFEGG